MNSAITVSKKPRLTAGKEITPARALPRATSGRPLDAGERDNRAEQQRSGPGRVRSGD
jgi:hypothetical protein